MNIETLITIVTYNSHDFILNCLDSITSSHYKKWFLSVVDNNSSDTTVEEIERLKGNTGFLNPGNFKIIKLHKNTGFSAAVNLSVFDLISRENNGLKDNIEYLVFINPDCILEKDTLGNLVEAFRLQKNRTGAAGGLIFNYDKTEIQNAGGKVSYNFITSHLTGVAGEIYPVDYVSGALFITGMSLFKSLGGFDSGYRPVYFEELDYCLKLKKLGYISVITKNAVAMHFEGASIKKFSDNFYRYYHKNRIRCAVLNMAFLSFFRIFVPEEIKWLKKDFTGDQFSAVLSSYLLNFLFLPYNLIIKLKNILLVKKLKS